jgi:Type I phosphodiesterase / nucleotide pyrophosphatase
MRCVRKKSAGPIVAAVLVLGASLGPGSAAAQALENERRPPRVLFIAIDAVPFATMQASAADADNAFLGSLAGPVPLISTFPSSTSLALAAILQPIGVAQSPGYEAKHYDRAANRVGGGGLTDYEPFPWRAFFDWKIEGLFRKAISAIRPIKAARKDIRESLEAFLASDAPIYFVYYDTTDSAGHLRSPQGVLPILADLDHQLQTLRRDHPQDPFWTVIFSDHGMDGGKPLQNTRAAVRQALHQGGFHLDSRIDRDNDVVIVPFGLVSSFVAYSAPGRELEAARAIAQAPGVDLCVTRSAEGFRIEAARGRATVYRMPTDPPRWRYEWSGEDPLWLSPDLHSKLSNGGWLTDAAMFAATLDHVYPDPFHRIATSFDRVENPASVVCSVARGHMFGAKITELGSLLSVGRLQWTHGALEHDASLGFLMSDVPSWKPLGPVRFDHALEPFTDLWGGHQLPVASR